MLNKNMINDLRYFGLNDYEARAYLILIMYGNLTASKICEYTKIPISKVYDVMNKLKRKGLSERWSSKPIKYKAIEPAHAINRILYEKMEAFKELKNKRNILVKKLIPLKTSNETWSSRGKTQFFEKIVHMLSNTKKRGYTITDTFSRYPRLDHVLKLALKRGVKIRMLGAGKLSEDSLVRALWYVNAGIEIKIFPMDKHPGFTIVDTKEACLKVDNDSNFIWSSNPAMLKLLDTYFEHIWKKATPIQRYLQTEQAQLLAKVS